MKTEVVGLNCIELAVKNLEDTASFYDKIFPVLGFEKNIEKSKKNETVRYDGVVCSIVLKKRPDLAVAGSDKFNQIVSVNFHAASSGGIDEIYIEFVKRGIKINPPRNHYEKGDRYYSCDFEDPEGHRFEISNQRES